MMLGYGIYFLGGLGLAGLFFFGIFTLFADSITAGFMMIGAAVVGGWVVTFLGGALAAIGGAILSSAD